VQWALRRSEVDAAREAIRINKNAAKQKNMVVGALSIEDMTDGSSRWPRSDVLTLIGVLITAVGSVAAVVAIPGLHDWIFGVSGPTSELAARLRPPAPRSFNHPYQFKGRSRGKIYYCNQM
jgi:hypothetical protein